MNKKNIEGIILRICCYKYKNIRKHFELKEKNILGWEIINVYGDINLSQEYIFENNDLIIKCEDTYLHLTIKLILSFKILNEIFNIKEGILRCGDDLVFNKDNLNIFLNIKNKNDYMGKNFDKKDIINPIETINLDLIKNDLFMINYYKKNITEEIYINEILKKYKLNINDINVIPNIFNYIALGHIYYLSNKSIQIIINHFIEKDNNQNFTIIYENNYYPYAYEDVGIGYILFKNNINFTNYPEMWFNPHYQNFDTEPRKYICTHTNEGNK